MHSDLSYTTVVKYQKARPNQTNAVLFPRGCTTWIFSWRTLAYISIDNRNSSLLLHKILHPHICCYSGHKALLFLLTSVAFWLLCESLQLKISNHHLVKNLSLIQNWFSGLTVLLPCLVLLTCMFLGLLFYFETTHEISLPYVRLYEK